MRFLVKGVTVENNLRGHDMRRIYLRAVEGDELVPDQELPEGMSHPEPDGIISILLGVKAAKKFAVGDVFTVSFREVE